MLPQPAIAPRLMGIDQAAAYLGLSPHTVYKFVSQRKIPHVKIGKLVKFDLALLDAWINKRTVMPMPPRRLIPIAGDRTLKWFRPRGNLQGQTSGTAVRLLHNG